MNFNEPKLEFVSIDTDNKITTNSTGCPNGLSQGGDSCIGTLSECGSDANSYICHFSDSKS